MFLKKEINLLRLIIFFLSFVLLFILGIIFFDSLKNDNEFIPDKLVGTRIENFYSISLYDEKLINFKNVSIENKFYLINIWSSWCAPCRDEHHFLVNLAKNSKLKIIGINYKDTKKNAVSFLEKHGNPYSDIFVDEKGSISINLGAYGIPETFLIDNQKLILLKFAGPLNNRKYQKIIDIVNNEK